MKKYFLCWDDQHLPRFEILTANEAYSAYGDYGATKVGNQPLYRLEGRTIYVLKNGEYTPHKTYRLKSSAEEAMFALVESSDEPRQFSSLYEIIHCLSLFDNCTVYIRALYKAIQKESDARSGENIITKAIQTCMENQQKKEEAK